MNLNHAPLMNRNKEHIQLAIIRYCQRPFRDLVTCISTPIAFSVMAKM